jgi:hypothetical protein
MSIRRSLRLYLEVLYPTKNEASRRLPDIHSSLEEPCPWDRCQVSAPRRAGTFPAPRQDSQPYHNVDRRPRIMVGAALAAALHVTLFPHLPVTAYCVAVLVTINAVMNIPVLNAPT